MKRKILDFSIMKEEISQNNVLEMAELIAFMELRFQIGYQGSRMQKMYADLYADITPKEICAKPKRITIKASTPLNTIEIKETFLSRNARLNLTMDELEQGIVAAETDVDKNKILLEALKIKRIRDIRENSFWNYALTLQEIIKLSKSLNLKDEELNAIFGLFYLDSSGYRMINGKYNPFKQSAEQMYYHPMPAVIAMAIQGAIGVWNDYFTFYMYAPSKVTISLGLYGLQSQNAYGKISYPQLFAAMIVATVPIIIIYASCQNFIIKNTTVGGIKG